MLLLVDGPDCVGKTYLVNALAQRLGARSRDSQVTRLHAGPPTQHPLNEYELPLLRYRPSTTTHVICDRWHLGELVYPGVLDRPSKLDDAVLRHIELLLASRGALQVVLTPDEDEVRACLARRGDPVFDPALTGAVLRGFTDAVSRTTLPTVWLKDRVDDDTLNVIIQEGEYHAVSCQHLRTLVTYVGGPRPGLLLLGDVRKTGSHPTDRRPAFMPYPATSGHYLMGALDVDPADVLGGVGVVNACDVDDPRAAWELLDRPITVTLGRAAQRVASWADRHAPHPQWQRRFRYHERAAYRELLLFG